MRRRDWFGSIVVAALIAAIPTTWGSAAATVLLVVAGLGIVAIVVDVVITKRKAQPIMAEGDEKARFSQHNVFGPNYAAETMVFQSAKAEPRVSYTVLEQNVSVGTAEEPLYRTSYGVQISESYAVERLRLEATPRSAAVPHIPSMHAPSGGPIDPGPGSKIGGGGQAVIEFNGPPSVLVFDVLTDAPDDIVFDARIVSP